MARATPKPLTPEAVRQRIVKRGVGNWVGVQIDNGAVLVGRIVSVDEHSFSLQLHNDPEVTPIPYASVISLQTGPSHGAIWAILCAGIGGSVAIALIAHHEMSNMPKQPNQPALP